MANRILPNVRLAMPSDEEDIVAMCRRLHLENGLFSLNENKVRDCLRRCFNRHGSIVGVIGAPGELQASICMELTNFYYTDDMHLAELWNFVDAPYRRPPGNAEALIEYAKDWARKLEAPFFTGIITNKQMRAKVRLYRQLLGYPVGAFFLYNGKWKTEPMADFSDLKIRMRQAAQKWSTTTKASRQDLRQIASLFRQAADALSSDGNIWEGSSAPAQPEVSATPINAD